MPTIESEIGHFTCEEISAARGEETAGQMLRQVIVVILRPARSEQANQNILGERVRRLFGQSIGQK